MPRKGYVVKNSRPSAWKTGPDPVRHAKYVAWMRAKAQANFRDEIWTLTFEEYEAKWGDLWSLRGRAGDAKILTRIDPDGAWSVDNTHIIRRGDFVRDFHADRRSRLLPGQR